MEKLKSYISELQNHQGFKKYFRNTSWLFFEKILRLLVGFLVGIWVIRYLGPNDYGLLSYVQSFVSLFAVVATIGLDQIVIRELIKNPENRDVLLGSAFGLKVVGVVFMFLFLGIGIFISDNDFYTNFLIFIIASASVFQTLNIIDFYFQSKVLSKFVVYANLISLAFSSFFKIVFILTEMPLLAFIFLIVFDSFVLALGLLYVYQRQGLSIFEWSFDLTKSKALIIDSFPIILGSIAVTIYMKIDQVMIKEMLGSKAVGQYAAAIRLSELWYFIPMSVVGSLFPAIIKAKQLNKQLLSTRLKALYSLMIWVAIAIAIPTTFLSEWLINLLFSGEFHESGSVLKIHIWSGIFVFLGVASGNWIISENLQKYSTINTFLGALLNVLLNIFLINSMGIVGAAWASLFSYFFSGYLAFAFWKKTRTNFYYLTTGFLPKEFFKAIKHLKHKNI